MDVKLESITNSNQSLMQPTDYPPWYWMHSGHPCPSPFGLRSRAAAILPICPAVPRQSLTVAGYAGMTDIEP